MTTPVAIHFDGDAHPSDNGPAAIGYVVEIDNSTEEWDSTRIGQATCNETKYHALIRGLKAASEKGCTEINTRGDPQLIVRQQAEVADEGATPP